MERRRFIGMGLAVLVATACEPTRKTVSTPQTPDVSAQTGLIIDTIRKMQDHVISRGEFQIPLPYFVSGGAISIVTLNRLDFGFSFLAFEAAAGLKSAPNVGFPALIDGTVSFAEADTQKNSVGVIQNDNLLEIDTPLNSRILVKKDQQIRLGEPLFDIGFDQNDEIRKKFGEIMALRENVFIMISWRTSKELKSLSQKNFLKDPKGNVVYLPNFPIPTQPPVKTG